MKLTTEQIKSITTGTVRIIEETDGIHFYRFTEEQLALYENVRTKFSHKSHATAGVRMEFETNSKELEIKTHVTPGSSRQYFSFEVFVNGERNGYLANFSEDDMNEDYLKGTYDIDRSFSKTFFLGEGIKKVCIYFPWSVAAVIEEMRLDEGAFLNPMGNKRKLLVYGDSITQGYDTIRPTSRYISRIADAYGLEEITKAIGGEVHCAKLAQMKDDLVPDYIWVAYGTNDWNFCAKEDMEEQCRGFYKALRENYPDVPIIVITPIWRKDEDADYQSWKFYEAEEVIRESVKPYENIRVFSGYHFVPHDEKYFADRYLHPTDVGFDHYFENLYAESEGCFLDDEALLR